MSKGMRNYLSIDGITYRVIQLPHISTLELSSLDFIPKLPVTVVQDDRNEHGCVDGIQRNTLINQKLSDVIKVQSSNVKIIISDYDIKILTNTQSNSEVTSSVKGRDSSIISFSKKYSEFDFYDLDDMRAIYESYILEIVTVQSLKAVKLM